MQAFAETFYKSKTWMRCRNAYVSKAGGLCEECLSHGKYTPGEIVHHKTPLTVNNISDPEITLSFDNLELLCRKCHGERHGNSRKRYEVDELGRVKAIDD